MVERKVTGPRFQLLMACGCPVVSTDCPSGPREILQDGAQGPLVPVGDDRAMADAILAALKTPPGREKLKARAGDFSLDHAVDQYLDVLLSTIALGHQRGPASAM